VSPLTSGATVSSSSVVSWVTANATVTLPPATTAGQLVILISATNGASTGFQAQAGSGDHTFDYNQSDSAISPVGFYGTMSFVSDGNHNWYLVNFIY
jgi:hypothetical protein